MSNSTTLQSNLTALRSAFFAIVSQGHQVATQQASLASSNLLTPEMSSQVDWATLTGGWVTPLATTAAHVRSLAGLSGGFSSCLSTALNGTSEVVRTDPLWTFIANISNTPRTNTEALSALQQTAIRGLTNFQTAITASGNTASAPLTLMLALLTAYAALVTSSITAVKFLDLFQTTLAEDAAGVMLWAARDSAGGDADMPFLLKTFKYTNTTDYDTNATALNAFASTNWSAPPS